MPATRHRLDGPNTTSLAHRESVYWHYHDEQQLVYPESGVLRVSTEAGSWVVPPQRAVWIPAGVAHSHRAHGPTRMLTLVFTVNPLRLTQPAVLAVSPLLREVIIALTGDGLDPRQRRNIERVALDQLRIDPARPFSLPQPADDRLRAIAGVLADNPADERGLVELGRAVGASDRTLSRLFRAETGMSFPQWRAQLRLQHSLELLATGTAVTAVAAASGYHSTSAFIETFRQAFGGTPGAYQRHLRSGTG
jgi:AraC-like DNA-binding protein